jgi:hypothetical protein
VQGGELQEATWPKHPPSFLQRGRLVGHVHQGHERGRELEAVGLEWQKHAVASAVCDAERLTLLAFLSTPDEGRRNVHRLHSRPQVVRAAACWPPRRTRYRDHSALQLAATSLGRPACSARRDVISGPDVPRPGIRIRLPMLRCLGSFHSSSLPCRSGLFSRYSVGVSRGSKAGCERPLRSEVPGGTPVLNVRKGSNRAGRRPRSE